MDDSSRREQAERSFRVAGLVAQAAKRFMRSINPPVTFGKPLHPDQSRQATGSSYGGSHPSSTGSTGGQKKVHHKMSRGHRQSYLFAPLAPDEPEK
jgi:hypothetical protein